MRTTGLPNPPRCTAGFDSFPYYLLVFIFQPRITRFDCERRSPNLRMPS